MVSFDLSIAARNLKTVIMKLTFAKLMLACFCILGMSYGCEQEEPENISRTGDSLFFAGEYWTIKEYVTSFQGPGPNYFSSNPNHVWVDSRGRLHMTISNKDSKWFATEVISTENTGYGTYRFTVLGNFTEMPENITLGLFTWDNNTFTEAANSEVDIELSKWGDTNTVQSLTYAVQPVNFGTYFAERTSNPELDEPTNLDGLTTHEFTWTESLITWKSYKGDKAIPENEIAEWSFDDKMQARVKSENDWVWRCASAINNSRNQSHKRP